MKKQKVLYLHGLESPQGGPKVDFLAKKGYVCAPDIDYTRSDIFTYLVSFVEEFEPDVIIGSSMGGYAAWILGGLYDIPVVAFNPALHSRSFEPKLPRFVKQHIPSKLHVVLGEKDTVIPHIKTLDYIKDWVKDRYVDYKVHSVKTMGHRVPLEEFIDIYNKIF